VKNGSRIILLEVRALKTRFLSHENYLCGNIYQIAAQFDVKFVRHFFPKSSFDWNTNLDYIGAIPDVQTFVNEFDSDQIIEEKKQFVNNFQLLQWNFRKELMIFIQQKLFLLAMSNLKFIEAFLSFQNSIGFQDLFSPFEAPLCTTGGAFFRLYKIMYLPKYPLHTVLNEYKSKGLCSSRGEDQVMTYIEKTKYPDGGFVTAFNNPTGQKYFKEAVPDGYGVTHQISLVCD